MTDFKKDLRQSGISLFFSAIRYCISLSWRTSKYYTLARFASSLILSFLPFVSLFMSKQLLDILTDRIQESQYFLSVIVLLLALSIVGLFNVVISKASAYITNIHNDAMQHLIQMEIIKKSAGVDIDYFDLPDRMDILQAAKAGMVTLPNIVWNLTSGISSSISLASAFVLLAKESCLFAILITVLSLPYTIYTQKYAKSIYKWRLSHIVDNRNLSYIQNLAGSKSFAFDIRLFDICHYLVDRYKAIWVDLLSEEKSLLKRKTTILTITGILPQISVFLILVNVTKGIFKGVNSVGDYLLYSGLLASLTHNLANSIDAFSGIYEDKLKIESVRRFQETASSIPDDGKLILDNIGTIEFRNVYFRYPQSDVFAINNMSFRIKQGEHICIVGQNGSGKSTIIKLLLRFYDITDGEILINETDIKSYTLKSLRRNFSCLFQQYDVLSFSLRENIIISDINQDCKDSIVTDMLKKVGANNVLEKANYNLDIMLSRLLDSNGLELSGGECQKIALARTVYRACSVLVLDEPSAALDPLAEASLFSELHEIMNKKIGIFTTHRMNTVHLADRILLLENGMIAEDGSHQELMVRNGIYAKLYKLQAERYVQKI